MTPQSSAPITDDGVGEYAHRLQVELTNLAGGGSENFVKHGDGFRADIPFCIGRIRDKISRAREAMKDAIRRARTAEANERTATERAEQAEARVKVLEEALRPFAHHFKYLRSTLPPAIYEDDSTPIYGMDRVTGDEPDYAHALCTADFKLAALADTGAAHVA